jgi:hypothetical protein
VPCHVPAGAVLHGNATRRTGRQGHCITVLRSPTTRDDARQAVSAARTGSCAGRRSSEVGYSRRLRPFAAELNHKVH